LPMSTSLTIAVMFPSCVRAPVAVPIPVAVPDVMIVPENSIDERSPMPASSLTGSTDFVTGTDSPVSADSSYWRPIVSTPLRSARSEEHTSELQSRFELVCRLLLEIKKSDHITEEEMTEAQQTDININLN